MSRQWEEVEDEGGSGEWDGVFGGVGV